MDLSPFGVRATAGTLRASEGVVLHHAWTEEGVMAGPVANGAQLLHLSVALCVLNDTYREAEGCRSRDAPDVGVVEDFRHY